MSFNFCNFVISVISFSVTCLIAKLELLISLLSSPSSGEVWPGAEKGKGENLGGDAKQKPTESGEQADRTTDG